MAAVQLIVTIVHQGAQFSSTLTSPWSAPLLAVLRQVLAEHGLSETAHYWIIRFERRFLRLDLTLAESLPGLQGRETITLEVLHLEGGKDRSALPVHAGSGVGQPPPPPAAPQAPGQPEVQLLQERHHQVPLPPAAPQARGQPGKPSSPPADVARVAPISAIRACVSPVPPQSPATAAPVAPGPGGPSLPALSSDALDLGALPTEAQAMESAVGLQGQPSEMESGVDLQEDLPYGETEEGSSVCALDDEAEEEVAAVVVSRSPATRSARPAQKVERRATVRYYNRMNPERVYPLLVVIAEKTLREITQRGVAQAKSSPFQVAQDSAVEIEPILPGCSCYPPRQSVRIQAGEVKATFWIIPQVLGQIMQPRVVLRQDQHVLADIPLTMTVVKKTMAVVMGLLGLVLPFLSVVLKHFNLDFESQLKGDFSLYARLADFALSSLSPEALAGVLLAAAAGFYFWSRPRQRDQFWDIVPATPDEQFQFGLETIQKGDEERGAALIEALLKAHPDFQPAWLYFAEWHYGLKDYQQALDCFEKALALGTVQPAQYLHAASSASRLRLNTQALAILQQGQASAPPSEHTGLIWYNMGCYAIRLGDLDEGMRYLHQAVEAGYASAKQYRNDPDLKVVRSRADFQQLLAQLGR